VAWVRHELLEPALTGHAVRFNLHETSAKGPRRQHRRRGETSVRLWPSRWGRKLGLYLQALIQGLRSPTAVPPSRPDSAGPAVGAWVRPSCHNCLPGRPDRRRPWIVLPILECAPVRALEVFYATALSRPALNAIRLPRACSNFGLDPPEPCLSRHRPASCAAPVFSAAHARGNRPRHWMVATARLCRCSTRIVLGKPGQIPGRRASAKPMAIAATQRRTRLYRPPNALAGRTCSAAAPSPSGSKGQDLLGTASRRSIRTAS